MRWFVEIRFPKLWMPVALYLPLAAILAGFSLAMDPRPAWEIISLIALGLFSWTLIEYFLHRFVFHAVKLKEPWDQLASAFHLSHHHAVVTGEPDVVITRPAGSLPFAILFFFLFALLSWSFSAAALIETGVFVGYLLYEATHYGAHHFHPRHRFLRYLKNYHLQHHFRDSSRSFGVTSPIWDRIFKT